MSEKASEENRAILIAKYGLDQPVYVQYGKYLQNLLHGDMGTSYVLQKGRAVRDIIFESFTVSMGLGIRALILAVICGIVLGCIAGLCKDKLPDAIIRVVILGWHLHAGLCYRFRADDFTGSQFKDFSGELQ